MGTKYFTNNVVHYGWGKPLFLYREVRHNLIGGALLVTEIEDAPVILTDVRKPYCTANLVLEAYSKALKGIYNPRSFFFSIESDTLSRIFTELTHTADSSYAEIALTRALGEIPQFRYSHRPVQVLFQTSERAVTNA